MSKTTYNVIETDTIQELERQVTVALAMGAILEGGIATAAVSHRNAYGEKVLQTFFQAYTLYEAY